MRRKIGSRSIWLLAFLVAAGGAQAQEGLDKGDTAWMMSATLLVLMMTVPGVALFYGGMVRKMNVLAIIMQSFAVTCLVTLLWMVAGYSLAFGDGNAFIGDLRKAFLDNMVVLAPDPEWVRSLPNGKLPDRTDFPRYGTNLQARVTAWTAATSASRQLADEFAQWLRAPDPARVEAL